MQDNTVAQWEGVWRRATIMTAIINAGREVYNSFFRAFLAPYLTRDSSMLELGCGTSSLTISLAPKIKRLVGLDISPAALELSKNLALQKGITNAEFIKGDCFAVPFENEFDVVWSQGLIEHFDNSGAIVAQHLKATKVGGHTIISVPYRFSYHFVWYILTRPQFLRPLWPWTEQKFYSKKDLLALGNSIAPSAHVQLLQPFFLGIALLTFKKQ